jgi:hypothetical protein
MPEYTVACKACGFKASSVYQLGKHHKEQHPDLARAAKKARRSKRAAAAAPPPEPEDVETSLLFAASALFVEALETIDTEATARVVAYLQTRFGNPPAEAA